MKTWLQTCYILIFTLQHIQSSKILFWWKQYMKKKNSLWNERRCRSGVFTSIGVQWTCRLVTSVNDLLEIHLSSQINRWHEPTCARPWWYHSQMRTCSFLAAGQIIKHESVLYFSNCTEHTVSDTLTNCVWELQNICMMHRVNVALCMCSARWVVRFLCFWLQLLIHSQHLLRKLPNLSTFLTVSYKCLREV